MRGLLLCLLLLPAPALAAEEARCRFDLAMLSNGQLREVRQSVLVTAERHQARVRVTRQGSWGAVRRQLSDGSDQITFDTDSTVETITIRGRGIARWDIRSKGGQPVPNGVAGYSGKCGDWRRKK
ncbi:hypothetical protein [Vannielia litorea]|uniref:hypothetical protein n=1 Tax=Vannielia litorea TaxID=1217970 RepID=UPI001BCE8B57|nr:hypothetical protein [Vannielia litorea]MBS8227707.1 hypothetical protein [Vannielia litorea]